MKAAALSFAFATFMFFQTLLTLFLVRPYTSLWVSISAGVCALQIFFGFRRIAEEQSRRYVGLMEMMVTTSATSARYYSEEEFRKRVQNSSDRVRRNETP